MKPYDSLAEFEAVRLLALNDATAAAAQLSLLSHVSTTTIVRVYYGPPGTGKTLAAVQQAVRLADPGFAEQADVAACFRRMNELTRHIAFVTFHPSLQYEDVVESIRPVLLEELPEDVEPDPDADGAEYVEPPEAKKTAAVGYAHYDGPIMRLAGEALRHPDEQFVLVIDEINRGDVSRILGPLLSTLEPDKRAGGTYPIGFERQYPLRGAVDTRGFLPANLHVLGTMNSADRNIALVDYALRRRFEFVALPPDPEKLAQTEDEEPLNLRVLLTTLNDRLAHLLDDDHRIGHGYFMRCRTNSDVVDVFGKSVLPLLFEYFYGDEGLVALVLGDRPGVEPAIVSVSLAAADFEGVFGMPVEQARAFGLSGSRDRVKLRVDPRFWNPNRVPPGPDDVAYAVNALQKLAAPPAPPAHPPGGHVDAADDVVFPAPGAAEG